MSIFDYTLLFLSVLAGGGLVFVFQRRSPQRFLPLILSFSGAYILGITAVHLMPGIFADSGRQAGFWLLGGFFIQLLLESLSQGVEHGHIHAHQHASPWFAVQIMIGLCLHAFLEGLPLGSYDAFHELHGHEHGTNHLLYGIVLHKAPAAFALVSLLLGSGFSNAVVVSCLLIFSAMSPLGSMLSEHLSLSGAWLDNLMALVVGSFLHIATTILFEADSRHHHGVSWVKLLVILIGVALALLTVLA